MPVATLILRRRLGRTLRVMVVTPHRPRRRRIAMRMRAAGWSVSRIGAALRISPQRIAPMLTAPRLFDPETLKRAAREARMEAA